MTLCTIIGTVVAKDETREELRPDPRPPRSPPPAPSPAASTTTSTSTPRIPTCSCSTRTGGARRISTLIWRCRICGLSFGRLDELLARPVEIKFYTMLSDRNA